MRCAAVLVVMGCGRLGFAPVPTGDGADAASSDGTQLSPCQTWSPFTVAVDDPLSSPGSDDWIPHISFDGLSLIQDEYNGTDFDLAVSRRATTSDAFPAPSPISGAATAATEQAGQFSADESRLYLLRHTGGTYELWQYVRTGNSYSPDFRHLQQTDQQHFWISKDEMRVYSIETRGAMGAIVQASRSDVTQQFDAGIDLLVRVGRPGMSLALSNDELELMVSMPAVSETDDLDIYFASRATPQDMFGPLTAVAELNTEFDDVVGSWTGDRTTAYLNLDTDTDGGRDADVWVATRTCLD